MAARVHKDLEVHPTAGQAMRSNNSATWKNYCKGDKYCSLFTSETTNTCNTSLKCHVHSINCIHWHLVALGPVTFAILLMKNSRSGTREEAIGDGGTYIYIAKSKLRQV